jgi:hypothetical protein
MQLIRALTITKWRRVAESAVTLTQAVSLRAMLLGSLGIRAATDSAHANDEAQHRPTLHHLVSPQGLRWL